MNMPNSGQVAAFGRHMLTAGATAVTVLAVTHLINADQASAATGAFAQIGDGVTKIIAGFGALIPIASGVYAALTASPLWQLISVAKNPAVQSVVADAPLANAVPSAKVQPPSA